MVGLPKNKTAKLEHLILLSRVTHWGAVETFLVQMQNINKRQSCSQNYPLLHVLDIRAMPTNSQTLVRTSITRHLKSRWKYQLQGHVVTPNVVHWQRISSPKERRTMKVIPNYFLRPLFSSSRRAEFVLMCSTLKFDFWEIAGHSVLSLGISHFPKDLWDFLIFFSLRHLPFFTNFGRSLCGVMPLTLVRTQLQ